MVSWIQSLINVLVIILPYGYSVLMHAYYGQTVGKILMSVKVVTYSNESDIGIGHALLRDIGPLIYIAVLYLNLLFLAIHGAGASPIIAVVVLVLQVIYWLWGLIEIVTMLFDDKSRSLPDYIAGTIAVRE